VIVVKQKTVQQYYRVYFILALIGWVIGSGLITFGLFGPTPRNSCNTSFTITVFERDITGELTTSTPNITTHLGHCSTIAIYSSHEDPFTLQIIDPTGYPYLSIPNFANYTTQHTHIEVTLSMRNYTLVAHRESTNATIELRVTASYRTHVLPCLDYQGYTIRLGFHLTGLLILTLSSYIALQLYRTLRNQHEPY
jgi:hypothetical protein